MSLEEDSVPNNVSQLLPAALEAPQVSQLFPVEQKPSTLAPPIQKASPTKIPEGEQEEWLDIGSEEAEEWDFDEEEADDEEEEGDEEDEDEEEEEEEEEEEIDPEEVKRILAKEKRQRRRERRKSPQNVEGAIPKETLRTLSNNMMRQLIQRAKQDIKRLKTENYLYERKIERLEEPEKLVEEMANKREEEEEEQIQMEIDKAKNLICSSSESSDDDDEEEEEEEESSPVDYSPLIPIDEINVSTDSFFDNMSDYSREAALHYFRNLGVIAPTNYDVIQHHYEEWVKGAKEDPDYRPKGEEELKYASRLDPKVYEAGMALINLKSKKTKVSTKAKKKLVLLFSQWISEKEFLPEDPEVDYGEFDISDTKQLKLEDKLKFALQAEEELRKEFYNYETATLREESSVAINVDAHKHCINLLLNLRRDFKAIMKDIRHPLSTKAMSDLILRLKRKIRNEISSDETKARMESRRTQIQRRRALNQLRCSHATGTSVSEIDFEHLTVENEIFTSEMEEMNLSLKYLKRLTNNYFNNFFENIRGIQEYTDSERNISQKIARNSGALKTFEKTFRKYRALIFKTKDHLADLKAKLKEYHAPSPLEYIEFKAANHKTEVETAALEKKLKELNLSLITARSNFASLCKLRRNGDQTDAENEAWLKEMKEEVAANNFMELLNDEDEEDMPSTLKIPKSTATIASSLPAMTSLPLSTRASSGSKKKPRKSTDLVAGSGVASKKSVSFSSKGVRKGGLQTLLASPRKFKTRKIPQPKDYDVDMDFHVASRNDS